MFNAVDLNSIPFKLGFLTLCNFFVGYILIFLYDDFFIMLSEVKLSVVWNNVSDKCDRRIDAVLW